MYEYKVLIVDDELHAIEMITRLLRQIEGVSLDIYSARNVSEAIGLLEFGRMDMVITDIEMPSKNGIELLSCIRSRWKRCRVVILTAFSQFQYAYSALQLRADGYILKTESDPEIRSKLHSVLLSIEVDMAESAHYAEKKMQHVHAVPKGRLLELIQSAAEPEQQLSRLREMGFNPSTQNLFLLMCREDHAGERTINETVLHELIGHYFRDSINCMELACADDGALIWLIELTGKSGSADVNRISGTLEMVQNACLAAFALPLSFVFGVCRPDVYRFSDIYRNIRAAFDRRRESDQPFILRLGNATDAFSPQGIPDVTLSWLCKYIEDNISQDLSLVNLAALTGYNPQYLSSLFRHKLDTTLSRYISDRRMERAREMLGDVNISIQDIAQSLGFASHSYFSRFIRKETNLTPQQLRAQLTETTEASSVK